MTLKTPTQLLCTFAILVAGVVSAEQETEKVKALKPHVLKIVEAKGELLKVMASLKKEEDIPKFTQGVVAIKESMATCIAETKKAGKLTPQEMNELAGIESRREYELYPDQDFTTEMPKIPKELHPSIGKVMELHMEDLSNMEDTLFELMSVKTDGRSYRAQSIAVPLEFPIHAEISFGNTTGESNDQPTFVETSVTIHKASGTSILYQQDEPWNGSIPDEKTLKTWITYDKDKRVVTFKLPKNTFNYALPKKRK